MDNYRIQHTSVMAIMQSIAKPNSQVLQNIIFRKYHSKDYIGEHCSFMWYG